MKMVIISADACGYYSDAEWHEEIYLTEESFLKIKDHIFDMSIYVSELDGKHSETKASISVVQVEEIMIENFTWDLQYDGYLLTEVLGEKLSNVDIDIDAEKLRADEFLATIDKTIKKVVSIKQSQERRFHEFMDMLRGEVDEI